MKKLLIATMAMAASSISFAQDSAVYDLMYFPAAGTIFGETGVSYTDSKYAINLIPNEVFNVSHKEASVEQTLGYVFSSKTMVGVNVEYQFDGKTTTVFGPASTSNGTTTKSKSSTGLVEPTVFIKERLKNQADWNYNLDLQASFSPKLSDAKSATTTAKGNAYRGNSQFELTAEIGKKNEANQWKASAMYMSIGKTKSKSASDSTDIDQTDSNSLFGASYSYQFKLSPMMELNLNAGIAFLGEQTIRNAHDATVDTIDSATVIAAGPELIFNLSSKMVVQLGYTFTSMEDSTFRELDTTTKTTTTLMKQDAVSHLVSVTGKYEF